MLEIIVIFVGIATAVSVASVALFHGPYYYREGLVDKVLEGVIEQEGLGNRLRDEAKSIIENKEDYVVISDWIRRNQDQFPGELQKTARRAVIMSMICRVYIWALIALIVIVSAVFGG